MDVVIMRIQILEDLILNDPLEEVQLSHRRVQTAELDALPTTEGIEHLLVIRLQVRLVDQVDNHMVICLSHERHIMLLRIIGNKPVEKTQAQPGLTGENLLDAAEVFGCAIELLKTVKNPLLLALNRLHIDPMYQH